MSRHLTFFAGKRDVFLGGRRIWERGGSEMIHSKVIAFSSIYVMVVG